MNKISTVDNLNKDLLISLFDSTQNIKDSWPNLEQIGQGKTVCLLFWEPSTRTKLSFEHAAKSLGFKVLDFSPASSSIAKGETLEDTIKTLLALKVDGFIIRHPEDKISLKIEKLLPDDIFFINAGDGSYAHPSQALLDVYTMKEKCEDFSKLKVAAIGDIKHCRIIGSQMTLLNRLGCTDIQFYGPKELLDDNLSPSFSEITDGCMEDRDILYVIRVKHERLKDNENIDMEAFKSTYQINESFIEKIKFAGSVMHPGPINIDLEISDAVATSEKSLISTQVENG
ncbi:MAG: aspartate carbamoyltransferase catalytic subunit, partial [Gammaproteobacteria bacterium]|nr:aspartate carbamoyltransferase catalytic subunit [Gammaproteobacteria bacterium]